LGYHVITVSDGQEAVEYYKEFGSTIDLVVIDMIMPRLSSRDCFLLSWRGKAGIGGNSSRSLLLRSSEPLLKN